MADDPAYAGDVVPFVLDLLPDPEGPLLDLGCGEGQVLRAMRRARPSLDLLGCDISARLLERAARSAPVVRCRLPELAWLRAGALGGGVAVLVVEHLEDLEPFFLETARVTRPGGTLVVVMNHPAYTPDGAGPIVDQTDGEVLWRWGRYFEPHAGHEPAGQSTVTFYHRPLGRILSVAAASGWCLDHLDERPLGPATVARLPGLAGQEHLPRLLGVRWRRVGSE